MSGEKCGIRLKIIVFLQAIVVIYSFAGVFAKFASGNKVLTFKFIAFYAAEILILFIYALLWQQVLKKIDLSIAYANRAVAIMWSMLWSAVIFGENITVKNIIGVLVVIAGTIVINSDD